MSDDLLPIREGHGYDAGCECDLGFDPECKIQPPYERTFEYIERLINLVRVVREERDEARLGWKLETGTANNLQSTLARERESRKQAEEALQKAHEQTEQAAHNLCTCVNRSTWSCNACMSLLPIERTLSAALAVQEPAERESGK